MNEVAHVCPVINAQENLMSDVEHMSMRFLILALQMQQVSQMPSEHQDDSSPAQAYCNSF